MSLKEYINNELLTIPSLCAALRSGEHLTFTRWGDGEFYALLGYVGANCDHHEYFPDMGDALRAVLASNPPYYLGLHLDAKLESETVAFLEDHGFPRGRFVWSGLFHKALVEGTIGQVWEALQYSEIRRDTVLIGPAHALDAGGKLFPVTQQIRISERNCWKDTAHVFAVLRDMDLTNCVVLFCAGMPANAWIDRLYRQYGETATFIDLGSTLDPYAGRQTRSFHKKAKI